MTQEQIGRLVEEYRRCRDAKAKAGGSESYYKYCEGKIAGIKFALETADVYVKEVAMLL